MTPAETAWFFARLFAYKSAESLISVWSLPSKTATMTPDPEAAAADAIRRAETEDVYVGVCPVAKRRRKGRGRAQDTAGLVCMWADIDYGPHHKKPVPPTEADAQRVIDRIGIRPSIVVRSGHGYHLYWLLNEYIVFESSDDRAAAESLTMRWSQTICAIAREMEYACDIVGDLARVLRVPGTMNRKDPTNPVPVTCISDMAMPPPEYDYPDAFESLLIVPEAEPHQNKDEHITVSSLKLDRNASVPAEKLEVLAANVGRAWTGTWNAARGFASASEYDMSLASFSAAAGWSDQDIANLIIQFRREQYAPKLSDATQRADALAKALRRDYLQRTIIRARSSRQAEAAVTAICQDMPADGSPPRHVGDDESEREKRITQLRKALGIAIERWIQVGREGATYRMILRNGTDVVIGRVNAITHWSGFFNRIYEELGVPIRRFKSHEWAEILKALGSIVEVRDTWDMTREGELVTWLQSYIEAEHVYQGEQWIYALPHNAPLIKDGLLHVHSPSFTGWLRKAGERPDNIFASYDQLGAEAVRLQASVEVKGHMRRYNRRYQRMPAAITEQLQLPESASAPIDSEVFR